ncbi:unnamed protein product [Cladocopium goreaui]|uniref:Uncharacterized protein n=2 Tax=Cladocopium goreaui TaxID=2562237 RepID=A0A9P1G1T8_9DINO|nr:unnamed protein product [Cladocopium goreaui]
MRNFFSSTCSGCTGRASNMLGRWSIDGVFTMRRIPREHQEWAQKKQIEAIKTFFATILVALVFVLVMYLAGYSPP